MTRPRGAQDAKPKAAKGKANDTPDPTQDHAPHVVDWTARARALPSDEYKPSVPLHVALGEAVDVARFFVRYWWPILDEATGEVVRPGLVSGGPKLPWHTADDILALAREGQAAQTKYLLTVVPRETVDLMGRAEFVLEEITGVLEWHFDDGVEDENDAKLASLDEAHKSDPDTADALAGALDDYAALALPHRAAIDGLGGFKVALLDEAPVLAAKLRERPVVMGRPTTDESRQALAFRNRILTLLTEHMGRVRSGARFVFRRHPQILRESTSAYERRRRAAWRRAAAKKAAGDGGNGTPTP